MPAVYICLGSNLGDRKQHIRNAVNLLNIKAGKLVQQSGLYETPSWGTNSGNRYLNQAILIETTLAPQKLMALILQLETELGRTRSAERYEDRIIDIDIIFYDDQVIESMALRVPHPLLQLRKFVLVPLCEIAPDYLHPQLQTTVAELLEYCPDNTQPEPFTN